MNTGLKRAIALGAVGATASGTILLFGTTAKAEAPENLASYAAFSAATPYGIVSRVPAETAGGFLYSSSGFNVGKAQAKAAGLTLGELGDLFVVSSAPPNTITSPPTVIYAQDPPQETAPNEASLSAGRSGGGSNGEVRNVDLEARANDEPFAMATAAGNAVISPTYNSGYSTSRSESTIADDGTVATKAITTVHDIAFGVPGAMLEIASAKSIASITIKPGEKPVTELVTQSYGATLAGVPVTIDENGVSINKQIAMPASSYAAFFAALSALKEHGLTLEPGPRVVNVTEDGASISGAVFTYRHQAPPLEGIPRPSDIGSDETFNLASVTAVASSRVREPLNLGGTPAGVDAAGAPGAEIPSATAPGIDAAAAPLSPGLLPGTAPVAAGGATPGEVAFALPARVANPLPQQMEDAYRFVLIAALIGIGGVLFIARQRNA